MKNKFILKKAISILILGTMFFSNIPMNLSLAKDLAVSLDVKSMEVSDVLRILAEKGKFNLSMSGEVKARVSLVLDEIDVWRALDIVLASSNLACVKKEDVVYVMSAREYESQYGRKFSDKRDFKVYSIKNMDAVQLKEFVQPVLSSVGQILADSATNTLVVMDTPENYKRVTQIIDKMDKPLVTKAFDLNYVTADEISEDIAELLTESVGTIKVNTKTNRVLVTDYQEKIVEIETMIKVFDEKPMQVLIDAKIVEIKPSKKFYSGISWDYWLRKYFKMTQSFSFPNSTTDKLLIGTPASVPLTEVDQYTGTMEFLQTFGKTNILSSPRILCLNNEEAKILVGTKDAYITSSVSEVGESAVTSQTINFVDVGVKLYVTPRINKKGYVTLKIKPEISSSQRETITSDNTQTEVPIVTTSEAETTVVVKDGVNILIGGLRKLSRDKEDKQVPVLGSIPLVGKLFKSKRDEWSRNELVILITPRIVSGDKSIEEEIGERLESVADEAEEQIFSDFDASVHDGTTEPQTDFVPYKKETADQESEGNKLERTEETDNTPVEKAVDNSNETDDIYYTKVIQKVKSCASPFERGNAMVKVSFILKANGELLEDSWVISGPDNLFIKELAKVVVRQAMPFDSFEQASNTEDRHFQLVLNL